MINQENYREVKAFLDYRTKVLQLDPKSIRSRWIELRHLLEWAGPKRFSDGPLIEPFFPTYLVSARNDGKEKALGAGMHQRVCLGGRLFYEWAKQEFPSLYGSVPVGWIKAIRPTKSILYAEIERHEAWELEDVLKIARLPVRSTTEKRASTTSCVSSSRRVSGSSTRISATSSASPARRSRRRGILLVCVLGQRTDDHLCPVS